MEIAANKFGKVALKNEDQNTKRVIANMLKIHVLVHLRPDILDVQGQAIQQAVHSAGHKSVSHVRVGKSFYLDIDAPNAEAAKPEIDRLCKDTLSNPLLETFQWEVVEQS